MSSKDWLALASVTAAVLGALAGIALIADEQSYPCTQREGFIPGGIVPIVVAAWALLTTAAIAIGWRGGWAKAKFGVGLGLIDLIGLPALGFVVIVAQVAQCIG